MKTEERREKIVALLDQIGELYPTSDEFLAAGTALLDAGFTRCKKGKAKNVLDYIYNTMLDKIK